jgi:hypothetical protein
VCVYGAGILVLAESLKSDKGGEGNLLSRRKSERINGMITSENFPSHSILLLLALIEHSKLFLRREITQQTSTSMS